MKKFVVFASLLVAFVGFANAADPVTASGDTTITGNVEKHVYITAPTEIALGEISIIAATTKSGVVKIRSNHANWTYSVYAVNGVLTQHNGPTYITGEDVTTIPYSFSFNAGQSIEIASTLMTTHTSTSPLTATFLRKTSGGAANGGESFPVVVSVAAAATGEAWDYGNYQDVLHMTVTAN